MRGYRLQGFVLNGPATRIPKVPVEVSWRLLLIGIRGVGINFQVALLNGYQVANIIEGAHVHHDSLTLIIARVGIENLLLFLVCRWWMKSELVKEREQRVQLNLCLVLGLSLSSDIFYESVPSMRETPVDSDEECVS